MTSHALSVSPSMPTLLETKSDHSRLRIRFNQLSKERRLLAYLLFLFAIIMCGLLIGIFILSRAFHERTTIIYRGINSTNIGTSDGVIQQNDQQTLTLVTTLDTTTSTSIIDTTVITSTLQETTNTEKQLVGYGESCDDYTGCERPFICQKKRPSLPGMCRCPELYDFVKESRQCVGDLNAICTKNADCQPYMICSGTNNETHQCQCQEQFEYDVDKRRCRGDYAASCEINLDCRSNLICDVSVSPSVCSCLYRYKYHPTLRKCRGDPGAVCDQATAECVDNAECRDGACDCSRQFISDKNKVCYDPCLSKVLSLPRIPYPGNPHRFIDCKNQRKGECPDDTLFNYKAQLCNITS